MKFLKKIFIHSALVLLLGLIPFYTKAQISVSATLDSNSILIGQQTQLRLSLSYNSKEGDIKILWPDIKDTIIKQIEIVDKTKIDTNITEKENSSYDFILSQALIITSFDSGYYAIPPFKFIINGDTSHPYETEALLLEVNSVAVDTSKAIRDIKPPMEEPFDIREILPYIYWGASISTALAILIYLLILYLKKRKQKPVLKEVSKLPAHIIALEALEKLKEEKLWQQGKIKQYYSALSEIIRNYIELRFKINALEQTTDEILIQFRSIVIDKESKDKLQQLLTLADLVKFAKETPIDTENEMSMVLAFDFINGTKREEITENNNSQEENNTTHGA